MVASRIALLATVALALDAGWLALARHGREAAAWPRAWAGGSCHVTLSEPQRDEEPDAQGLAVSRIAFSCARAREATLHGVVVVRGTANPGAGMHALSGAQVASVTFPTIDGPDEAGLSGACVSAIEEIASGEALGDADPRLRPVAGESLFAGSDGRVYALRGGSWQRQDASGAWSGVAERGSADARRNPRLSRLERVAQARERARAQPR